MPIVHAVDKRTLSMEGVKYAISEFYDTGLFYTVPLPPTDVQLGLEFYNGTPSINAIWMVSFMDIEWVFQP